MYAQYVAKRFHGSKLVGFMFLSTCKNLVISGSTTYAPFALLKLHYHRNHTPAKYHLIQTKQLIP